MDDNVIKEVLYDPFGGIIEDTNPSLRLPIGFAGGLHDRDLGFVRFGWRDYDVRTGRWTAPDPIGDKGGDPDWYGYCLDDPVNGVDPAGLMGTIDKDISPEFPEVWQWQTDKNACDKCQALDGTVYATEDEAPEKPHPNCKCQVVRCYHKVEYGAWRILSEDVVRYEMNGAFCFGAVCRVAWHRISIVQEQREKMIIRVCGSRTSILKTTIEKRRRKEVEVRQADGMAIFQGGDPTLGDVIISTTPWNPYDSRKTHRAPGP